MDRGWGPGGVCLISPSQQKYLMQDTYLKFQTSAAGTLGLNARCSMCSKGPRQQMPDQGHSLRLLEVEHHQHLRPEIQDSQHMLTQHMRSFPEGLGAPECQRFRKGVGGRRLATNSSPNAAKCVPQNYVLLLKRGHRKKAAEKRRESMAWEGIC